MIRAVHKTLLAYLLHAWKALWRTEGSRFMTSVFLYRVLSVTCAILVLRTQLGQAATPTPLYQGSIDGDRQ